MFRNCLFICKVSSYFKEFVYFVVREFQRVPSLRTADKEFILFVRNESYFNGLYKLLGSFFFSLGAETCAPVMFSGMTDTQWLRRLRLNVA